MQILNCTISLSSKFIFARRKNVFYILGMKTTNGANFLKLYVSEIYTFFAILQVFQPCTVNLRKTKNFLVHLTLKQRRVQII